MRLKSLSNSSPRVAWLITVAVCIFLLYRCIGTWFAPFDWDEVFFLHSSWANYQDFSLLKNRPADPFIDLLTLTWSLIDGVVARAWIFRLIIFLFVFLQGILIYLIAGKIIPNSWSLKGNLRFLLSIGFIAVTAAFRGYEVRPEVIANTLIIFSGYVLVRLGVEKNEFKNNLLLVLIAGLGLICASLISMRHVLPAVVLMVGMIINLWSGCKEKWINIIAVMACWVSFSIFTHLYIYSVLTRIKFAGDFQSVRKPFAIITRLTIGGGIYHPHLVAAFVVLVIFLVIFYFLKSYRLPAKDRGTNVFVYLICLLVYFAFLFAFDVQPYEYVRSIEWLILFLTFLSLLHFSIFNVKMTSVFTVGLLISSIFLLFIGFSAIQFVEQRHPSRKTLSELWQTKSFIEIEKLSDQDLARVMLGSLSIFNQVRGRAEFCKRYPAEFVTVDMYKDHPICMFEDRISIDMGKRAFSNQNFDITKYQFATLPPNDIRRYDHLGYDLVNIDERRLWIKK